MGNSDHMQMTRAIPRVFIVGPTAVGKSATALSLARRVGGEIISVDSMQVYRGLDIGTAKPTRAELAEVRHHLIDVVNLTEPFDAAKFCDLAKKAEQDILGRNRIPIFCGGTGLYFKAYLDGLGEAPPSDETVRRQLEATPLPDLLGELEEKDPITFARIDRQNPRRVIRALEVIRITGKPFAGQRANWKMTAAAGNDLIIGLSRESEELKSRINARVDEMFRAGLVDETRRLLPQGLDQNKTAMQAIGYRQVVEHLRGERSLPETIELVKIKTRQFAKRQMTWFRGQMTAQWVSPADQEHTINSIAASLGL